MNDGLLYISQAQLSDGSSFTGFLDGWGRSRAVGACRSLTGCLDAHSGALWGFSTGFTGDTKRAWEVIVVGCWRACLFGLQG